jgi:hypothetical protein
MLARPDMPSLVKRLDAAKRVAGMHLLLSLAIAVVVAVIVFALLFPFPHRDTMGIKMRLPF